MPSSSHPHALRDPRHPLLPLAAAAAGVGALWYLVCETIAAIGFPGYSYAHDYISDLGVPESGDYDGRMLDSRLADVMNAGFLGYGAALVAAGVLLYWASPRRTSSTAFLVLALLRGFGIAIVGVVHGGPVNAAAGLGWLHVLGAGLAIVGGNGTAILGGVRSWQPELGRILGRTNVVLGVVGLVCVIMLEVSQTVGAGIVVDFGVWERGAVYTIVAVDLLVAGRMLALHRSAGRGREEG